MLIPKPLLSIIVPTYNRAPHLRQLLSALEEDLSSLPNVQLIVTDNDSSDDTHVIISSFQLRNPEWIHIRNDTNLGPAENMCLGIERSSGNYCWVMSDDDLPRAGSIEKIVTFLTQSRLDLLYVKSEWHSSIERTSFFNYCDPHPFQLLQRLDFASAVNVWVTFISGMIVNMATFRSHKSSASIRLLSHTRLPQLQWVLNVLMHGQDFYRVNEPWIMGTKQTIQYDTLEVFGPTLVECVELVCGKNSSVTRRILTPLLWQHIPILIWMNRTDPTFSAYPFKIESLGALRHLPVYSFLLRPLATLPLPLARCLMFVPKIYSLFIHYRFRPSK